MTSKIIVGLKWVTIEKFITQFIQFFLSIVIARMISPAEYGVLGILLVFINIAQVFIDSGLGSSLIYFRRLDKNYLDTTFLFNLGVSVVLFIGLFCLAPFIEKFYELPSLSLYVKISSIVLVLNSLIVVPTSILKIDMNFRALSISNVVSTLISAIIGVALAYKGFGVWALILQLLSRSLFQSFMVLVQVKWVPSCNFNVVAFRELYKYGVNIFASSVVTKFCDEGISTIIAKYVSPFSLGIFSRSGQFASFPGSFVGAIINSLLFPSLASFKTNKSEFDKLYRNVVEYQSFLLIPLYIWIAVNSKPIVFLLLTENWSAAVPVLQILCLGRILSLISVTTEQVIKAKGRSDLFFRQQVIKLILKISLVVVSLKWGIIAIAIADAIQTIMQFFITNFYSRKVNEFNIQQQYVVMRPYLISSIISGLAGWYMISVIDNLYLEFLLSSIVMIMIYVLMLRLIFKKTIIEDLFCLIRANI